MRPVFHRRNLGYRAEGDDSVARSLEKRTQPTGNSNADSKTPLDDSKQPSRARFLDLTVVEFGGLRDWLAPSGAAKLFTGAGATDAVRLDDVVGIPRIADPPLIKPELSFQCGSSTRGTRM